MFTSIELEHFKGLEKLAVQGLAQITLIGGRNNVGKSSLLEAIYPRPRTSIVNPSHKIYPYLLRDSVGLHIPSGLALSLH